MFVIGALIPLVIVLLLVFQWSVYDAGWTTLESTIAQVSLIPAFHQTLWQTAIPLGEGSATTLTGSVILLPALFFQGERYVSCHQGQSSG